MRQVYDKTKNKIKNIWNFIDELRGIIETLNTEVSILRESNTALWQEINKPKTIIKKNNDIIVDKSYLIKQNSSGVIETDSNGIEKISPLFSNDILKSGSYWDEESKIHRLLARKLVATQVLNVTWTYIPAFIITVEGTPYTIHDAYWDGVGRFAFAEKTYDLTEHAYICIPKMVGSPSMISGTSIEPLFNIGGMLIQPWNLRSSTNPVTTITGYLYEF